MSLDESKIKTIFCDLDGVVFEHREKGKNSIHQPILPGVKEKFKEWNDKNYHIILTTARNHTLKQMTEECLMYHELKYNDLIMNIGSGQRILINDMKPYEGWENEPTAIGINIKRDEGLINVAH